MNERYDVYPELETLGIYPSRELEQEFSFADFPLAVLTPLRSGLEAVAVRLAVTFGHRDEDKLTNLVFFARHPNRWGRRLRKDEPGFKELSKEWLDIRNNLVRPILISAGAATGAQPPTERVPLTTGAGASPPAEGPYAGIIGKTCASGRGKCWRGARSRDIIDADVPWNDASNRSAANYDAVLNYFNVGNSKGIEGSKGPENPRYTPSKTSTYCNIYVHDVTRAMWASIPHWVRDPKRRTKPAGWNELSANRSVNWLLAVGRSHGWIPIDASLCDWIRRQFKAGQSLHPAAPTITDKLRIAAQRIAASRHSNPALLSQPSYVAQQFANQGLPTVTVWKNPNPRRSGHMAMIRPEHEGRRGELRRGVFVPRSAQAGRYNWVNQLAKNMALRKGVLFFVHE